MSEVKVADILPVNDIPEEVIAIDPYRHVYLKMTPEKILFKKSLKRHLTLPQEHSFYKQTNNSRVLKLYSFPVKMCVITLEFSQKNQALNYSEMWTVDRNDSKHMK